MMRASAWLLGTALALAGCADDRQAGTETGNPEIVVSARIAMFEYGRTRTTDIPFLVMGMQYSVAPPTGPADSGRCWARPGGTLANLAAHGSKSLPDTAVEDLGPWRHADIVLRSPDGPEVPDSADIATWSSPRYAKFEMLSPLGNRLAFFEMPQGAEYRLRSGMAATEAWRVRDSILIPIWFNATKWTDTLAAIPGLVPREDGRNAAYLVFSPSENAAAWNALRAQLPKAFYADSVSVR
jgi:hypothetical protein